MYNRFADVYGSGTYGDGSYACNTQTQTGTNCGTAGTTGSSNPLANTGVLVALIVAVAAFLLLVVVLVRFWRRPSAKAAQKPQAAPANTRPE